LKHTNPRALGCSGSTSGNFRMHNRLSESVRIAKQRGETHERRV
jgi:hypothetical protein